MAQEARELTLAISTEEVWMQMELDGSPYSVPTGGRADIALVEVVNRGESELRVDVAISADSSISNDERVGRPVYLEPGMSYEAVNRHVMHEGQALWVRIDNGGYEIVTVRAAILEIVSL